VSLFFNSIKFHGIKAENVVELHSGMWQKMRVVSEQWKKDPAYDGLYGKMGETVATFFNGEDGERLQKATSAFCQDQQQGLRALAERYLSLLLH
jgi:hypothetical protein